jgi:hypothetical protein
MTFSKAVFIFCTDYLHRLFLPLTIISAYEDMPKSRAQFTPMRTTATDSRTKIVITLDTICRPDPLFENRLLVEQRIWPTHGVNCNNNLSSAIGRCGAQQV